MPRIKIDIKKSELIYVILAVEANGPLANRSVLHDAVAASAWARKHPANITPAVVGLRIKEFGINPKTQMGRKFRDKGVLPAPAAPIGNEIRRTTVKPESVLVVVKHTPMTGSFSRDGNVFDRLKADAPRVYHSKIESARRGCKDSAIEINCAQCVGFEDVEVNVRGCVTNTCIMHSFRPYQTVTVGGKPA